MEDASLQALERAAEALPRSVAAGLRIMALRSLGDCDEIDDVVQETLARALEAQRHGRIPRHTSVAAYVHGIARHVIADCLRARMRSRAVGSLDHEVLRENGSSPLDALVSDEEARIVRRALGQLSQRERDLLDRVFVRGERIADLASRMGEPAERLRKRKSRALERLRRLVAPADPSTPAPDAR